MLAHVQAYVTPADVRQPQEEVQALHPVLRALLLGRPATPPAPVFPHDNTLVLDLGGGAADYRPLAAVEGRDDGSCELIERYEMEGELPHGIQFDEESGAIAGSLPAHPLPDPLDFAVRIRTANRVASSEWTTVQIKVTSDMRELLEPDHSNVVRTVLAKFPTLAALRAWLDRLHESDRDSALEALLKEDMGLTAAAERFVVKGLLKQALEPTTPLKLPSQPRPPPQPISPSSAPRAANSWQLLPTEVQLGAHIGDGGQASVYRGRWQGVDVAVKVFGFGSGTKSLAKLRREIDREVGALSTLRHPHIVQLYGYFEEERRTGIVMEYCADGDLGDWCIEKSLHAKLVAATEVALALAFLHSRSPAAVVHGDVKPQNVLMSNGRAKLADFAMSAGAVGRASMSVSLASRAAVTGTDAYSSPEVVERGRSALSPASDVFSLGMLLYHVVEEEVPWAGERPDFVVRQVREGQLPPFRSEDWSPELQELVQRCCAKEPADRWPAEEAARRLTGILEHLPPPNRAEDAGLAAQIATLAQQVAEMHVATVG